MYQLINQSVEPPIQTSFMEIRIDKPHKQVWTIDNERACDSEEPLDFECDVVENEPMDRSSSNSWYLLLFVLTFWALSLGTAFVVIGYAWVTGETSYKLHSQKPNQQVLESVGQSISQLTGVMAFRETVIKA
jgi:hypothetical protein